MMGLDDPPRIPRLMELSIGRKPLLEALPVPLEQDSDSVSDIDGNDDREDPSSDILLEYLRSWMASDSSSIELDFFILIWDDRYISQEK